MVGCVWRSGGEGDEMGEGANGIEGAFEGGVRGHGGLEANFCTNSSTHRSLEGHELANIRRRNRSFPPRIILTLRTLGHPHTCVLWLSTLSPKILSKTHCRRRSLSSNLSG